jgi:hypothetical protein
MEIEMPLRGWRERFSVLSLTDVTKRYERSKRRIDRGLIRRGPKGYGIDLEPEEVARALVAAFIPASGGGSVERAEKLLAARPFARLPQGGFVATGEPKTFEAALVEMLSGEIGDIEAVALDGTIPTRTSSAAAARTPSSCTCRATGRARASSGSARRSRRRR